MALKWEMEMLISAIEPTLHILLVNIKYNCSVFIKTNVLYNHHYFILGALILLLKKVQDCSVKGKKCTEEEEKF